MGFGENPSRFHCEVYGRNRDGFNRALLQIPRFCRSGCDGFCGKPVALPLWFCKFHGFARPNPSDSPRGFANFTVLQGQTRQTPPVVLQISRFCKAKPVRLPRGFANFTVLQGQTRQTPPAVLQISRFCKAKDLRLPRRFCKYHSGFASWSTGKVTLKPPRSASFTFQRGEISATSLQQFLRPTNSLPC